MSTNLGSALDLRFSDRRRSVKGDRRGAAARRANQQQAAFLRQARANPVPRPVAAPPIPVHAVPARETPAQRQANDQLRARAGGVITVKTSLQWRLHVEQSTPTALLRRHYHGTPRGMREAQRGGHDGKR